jgi:diadenosine tetraphosphate (Ap4A) HIT family hydrolase
MNRGREVVVQSSGWRTVPDVPTDPSICPFCRLIDHDREILDETASAIAFKDAYPSAVGHVLVVPRRHVGRLLDLTEDEFYDLWYLARAQMRRIEPGGADAFTIGVNDGAAAGQTIAHAHLHVIPRRHGDTAETKGGVRWVIPETAPYWNTPL